MALLRCGGPGHPSWQQGDPQSEVLLCCETSQTAVVASPPALGNLQCHLLTEETTAGRCGVAAALSWFPRSLVGAQAR